MRQPLPQKHMRQKAYRVVASIPRCRGIITPSAAGAAKLTRPDSSLESVLELIQELPSGQITERFATLQKSGIVVIGTSEHVVHHLSGLEYLCALRWEVIKSNKLPIFESGAGQRDN